MLHDPKLVFKLKIPLCHAGLYLRNWGESQAPIVANFTTLPAQDYKGSDLVCSQSIKAGFCQLLGQPQVMLNN